MSEKISWEYFIKRRRVNVEEWLKRRGIKNYSSLCETLDSLNVAHPLKKKVNFLFKKAAVVKKTPEPVAVETSESPPKVKKPKSKKRSKSQEDS